MIEGINEVLFTEEEIKLMVTRIGRDLTAAYSGLNPLIICILKGSIIFTSDLIREMNCQVELDSIEVSSYQDSTVSSGKLVFEKKLNVNVEGRHVILVEDIIDSGYTMSQLLTMLLSRKAASVKIACLLMKPECLKHNVKIDYVGAEIENKFVVGYGMDFAQKYRNLKYIGVLDDKAWRS